MAKIYYHAVPADWRKEQKYHFLDEHESVSGIDWTEITPDAKQNWLTAGMEKEFDGFLPLGSKEAKATKKAEVETIFKTYSRGIATCRDSWVYNFQLAAVEKSVKQTAEFYNQQLFKRHNVDRKENVDEIVVNDDRNISWSEGLKARFLSGRKIVLDKQRFRNSVYRPFQKSFVYFDRSLIERVYVFPSIFPTSASEKENKVICLPRSLSG